MYFQCVVIPVKTGNKQEFLDMAPKMSSIFAEHGAIPASSAGATI